jgi:ABC-2 type transport system ATP-binding protein
MKTDLAFRVEHLSKSFEIPTENRNTIKERLMHFRNRLSYDTLKVLDDISFEIKKGEFFSIIGRNGSGKSTLLKILAGIYTADKGKITVNGEISPFLELGVGFNPELSGKDNVYLNSTLLGQTKKEIDRNFEEIVAFSELEQFIHLKLKNYSSGMQVRLAFATAIQTKREILIMDEVLAVGDAAFKDKCYDVFEKIIASGRTIIFVSHDIGSVMKYSDRVMYLEAGKIACIGSAAEAVSQYLPSHQHKES